MMPLNNVLAFAGTVVLIVAVPGPSVLFTISRALTVGRRATMMTVAGNAVGVLAQVVVSRSVRAHWRSAWRPYSL